MVTISRRRRNREKLTTKRKKKYSVCKNVLSLNRKFLSLDFQLLSCNYINSNKNKNTNIFKVSNLV
jgi:hypothetical protein